MSEALKKENRQKILLEQLSSDSNEQWALVELYRWEHGELPRMGEQKPLSIKNAVMKMAEAFTIEDEKKWPAPMNIASVLAYLASKLLKTKLDEAAAPATTETTTTA